VNDLAPAVRWVGILYDRGFLEGIDEWGMNAKHFLESIEEKCNR
jgi:hypothetical protein